MPFAIHSLKNELNLCYHYFIVVNLEHSPDSFQEELTLFAQTGFGLSTKHSRHWR